MKTVTVYRADLGHVDRPVIVCTLRSVEPTLEQSRADDEAYEWDLARFGQCPHKAAYPMGRWIRCIDCDEYMEPQP